jgi:CRISPR-associated protein Csm4
MRLYKTTLIPISNFATMLKGDTMFGQICWAIRYTFGEVRLEALLSSYETAPFLVVSDGFAAGFVPKPSLPSSLLSEDGDKKKENRKNIWLTLKELQNGNFDNAIDDEKTNHQTKTTATVKNSLNYKTFTTDDSGTFAPYSESESSISPKDVYFLIDDSFSLDELQKALSTVSLMGYGKNSSIGKGFFEFGTFEEVKLNQTSKTFMTLSPAVLEGQNIKNSYYEPFTRFGKHGAGLANKNPFKKPLLMANSGAIVVFEDNYTKPYIGKAIQGHSTHQNTVHQGYSIVLPIIKEFEV